MSDAYDMALTRILASKNYRSVCPDAIRRVLSECFARFPKPKDAEKAAREKLHGITGAFMTPREFERASLAMARRTEGDDGTLAEILSQHASTRERLPLSAMDALYQRVFAIAGRPRSILDLACGLNPVYLAARGMAVTGADIQGGAVDLINRMGEEDGLPVRGIWADLLSEDSIPKERFDLALMMKLLPVLEGQRKGAGVSLLANVNARFRLVSFPTRTLGGREVGMRENYGRWMAENVPDDLETADEFEAAGEMIFILRERER